MLFFIFLRINHKSLRISNWLFLNKVYVHIFYYFFAYNQLLCSPCAKIRLGNRCYRVVNTIELLQLPNLFKL